ELADESFDMVVTIFGAMFAPKPFDVAKEMVRVTRKGGRIVMGNWIPGDPTLVAQILKISSAYTPAPPEGFVSAGVAAENISFLKDTYTFDAPYSPSTLVETFKNYYGPTMNAFEAAKKNNKDLELQRELEELFMAQNRSADPNKTSIPATFLRVTVRI